MGKLHPADCSHLQRGSGYLAQLLQESSNCVPVSGEVLLIGLTESGIVPSFLMYMEALRRKISCKWVCSTRRVGVSGIPFQEIHSHGPHHILPLPEGHPEEIWIVEDEITSGTTVKNLLNQMQKHVSAKIFRIFSFADSRSQQQKDNFFRLVDCSEKTYLFHSAASLVGIQGSAAEYCKKIESSNKTMAYYHKNMIENVASELNKQHIIKKHYGEHLFVIGEAISTAVFLVAARVFSSFQHITLSPWTVDTIHIKSRVNFCNYFLYNYQRMKSPVHLLYDPTDHEIGNKVKDHLEKTGMNVEEFALS
ncbi:phosphoribosyltransferase domain-containing protein [Desulfobulbus sp. F1]|nr:phosphoribosyltransferase domain-containing protein [Desulfobulbus sp. F1]